jgi:hypothetical protein
MARDESVWKMEKCMDNALQFATWTSLEAKALGLIWLCPNGIELYDFEYFYIAYDLRMFSVVSK